jgi:dihydroxy-acid dehydratase
VNGASSGVGKLSITEPCALLGHVVPEARLGGPIALVKDGDRIIVDSEHRAINWLVDEVEQRRRKQDWDASDKGVLKEKRGVLFRYARDVAVSPTLDVVSLILNCLL